MEIALTNEESARLKELENVVERGKQTFIEVGMALMEIKEKELWKPYGSFPDYCEKRWGFSKRFANLQIEAVKICESVGTIVPIQNEGTAREFVSVSTEDRPAVAEAAKKIAEEQGRDTINSRDVKEAKAKVKAEVAGVSHTTVQSMKQVANFATSPASGNISPAFKTGKDGKKQPAAKKKQSQPELYFCQLCNNSFTEKEGDCPRCFPPEEVEIEHQSEEDSEFEEMFKVIAESFQQMIFDARTQWTDKQLARLRKEVENLFTCAVPASHMEV